MRKQYFIDLFCGAGGVTTGIHAAEYRGHQLAEVIACVTHDATAIQSHLENHPNVVHYTEDIRTLDLTELTLQVSRLRLNEPEAIICLWASLECTNFSKAKGGLPRDADSRTLASHLFRYIEALDPDMIWIENVEEFMSWGPLCENGKPISRLHGRDYSRWHKAIQRGGYNYEWRILNAADFGAYTSRKRFFAQFAKPHLKIAWPEQTHAKKLSEVSTVFGEGVGVKKWKPVREVLNLEETGESIFIPGRIKSDKTFERIYHGLLKFVAGGKKAHDTFMLKFNSTGADGNVKHSTVSIENPSPTIDTQNRIRIINPVFLIQRKPGNLLQELQSNYLISFHHSDKSVSIEQPLGSLTCKDKKAFISAYYGNGHNCTNIDSPAPTVTTGDRFVIVSPQLIYRDFSNGGSSQTIDSPAGAVQTNPKLNLLTCNPFLMDTQFTNGCKDINDPAPTQTSSRHHYYLMNPQWFNTSNSSVDAPCFTIIARQDKTPAYLVCAETGLCAIEAFDTDLPHALMIKAFMVLYGITDIKMRMLQIIELLRIQGFGDNYILKGTKTKQKWMLGNAVEVNQATVLIKSSCIANLNFEKVAA